MDPLAREVIRLRLAVSQAATKKYAGLLLRQIDGRMNDTLQVWGAGRTGRWGGRALQPQNLKRPPRWLDPHTVADAVVGDYFPQVYGGMQSLEILGGSVRAVITATEGKTLVVSDLASIESRVVGWLSGCRWINDLFAHGKDSYKSFAELWMGVPYEQVTKEQRNQAKPPFLGFAYRLGGKGLVKYADSMGIDLTEAQCKEAITAARSACWEIPEMWATLEHVAETVIRTRQPVTLYKCTWRIEGDFLTIQLPSKTKLYYYKPKWEQVEAPWGDTIWQMTYMGQSQFTNQWTRLQNHGGRGVEQITQAIAKEILKEGMLRYTNLGGSIVGHVHDEGIAEEEEANAKMWLDAMNGCLVRPPEWAPDLLLGAEGYVSKRYKKG